jgi:nitrate/nitrite transport system ATP-binding protein
MVTHDVDEALYLSDRVVMMTSGPGARVGEVLTVPFARPRDRQAVLEHSDYYAMRERLIGFLEEQAQPGAPGEETTTPVAETTIPGVVIARRLIG